MAKHFNVLIKYNDPYPKEFQKTIQASSAGRAANLVEKEWKKTRPRKRAPITISFWTIQL